jgi:hypothetical protein
MMGRETMKHRRWANVAVIIAGMFALLWGLWRPPAAGPQVDEVSLWGTQVLGGALGVAAPLIALKWGMLSKISAAAGGLILLGGMLAVGRITLNPILTTVLPALVLLAAAPFMGTMPTPEDEGKRR